MSFLRRSVDTLPLLLSPIHTLLLRALPPLSLAVHLGHLPLLTLDLRSLPLRLSIPLRHLTLLVLNLRALSLLPLHLPHLRHLPLHLHLGSLLPHLRLRPLSLLPHLRLLPLFSLDLVRSLALCLWLSTPTLIASVSAAFALGGYLTETANGEHQQERKKCN